MSTTIVVGNPKPKSRTYHAAHVVVERLTGRPADTSIDLVDLGAALLDGSAQPVADAIADVRVADLVVVASPTYKAAYTGLLKLFLDRLPAGGLRGVLAVPLMLGGHWKHSLAAELMLKPVLVELGATVPTAGLFLLDTEYEEGPALDDWLATARDQLARHGYGDGHPAR